MLNFLKKKKKNTIQKNKSISLDKKREREIEHNLELLAMDRFIKSTSKMQFEGNESRDYLKGRYDLCNELFEYLSSRIEEKEGKEITPIEMSDKSWGLNIATTAVMKSM